MPWPDGTRPKAASIALAASLLAIPLAATALPAYGTPLTCAMTSEDGTETRAIAFTLTAGPPPARDTSEPPQRIEQVATIDGRDYIAEPIAYAEAGLVGFAIERATEMHLFMITPGGLSGDRLTARYSYIAPHGIAAFDGSCEVAD